MSLLLARATLWVAVVLVLTAAAGVDLRRRIVPNELVMLVAAGGLALSLLSPTGSILSMLMSVAFCLVVLLALLVCAHFNVLGAGDAKLIAAVTLLVPPERIALLMMAIALAGGLVSGVYFAAFHVMKRAGTVRRYAAGLFADAHRAGTARMRAGYSVPYAVAVLVGVALYLASELYQCSSGISCSL